MGSFVERLDARTEVVIENASEQLDDLSIPSSTNAEVAEVSPYLVS
jgi:hypothetical protein